MNLGFSGFSPLSKVIVLSGFLLSAPVFAGSADVQLSNDAVRASLELPVSNMAALSSYTLGYQKDKGTMGAIGFHAVDLGAISVLQTGIGVKAYTVNLTQASRAGVFAGISGFVRGETALGIGGELELSYSPEILSFMTDAKSMVEGQARVTYRVMQQAKVFIGYSGGTVNFTDAANVSNAQASFEDRFNLGFRMSF